MIFRVVERDELPWKYIPINTDPDYPKLIVIEAHLDNEHWKMLHGVKFPEQN